jgi:hypothetical protein
MRPPGYVRPTLPFDSLDRVLAAAGVDLAVWRGLRVLAGWPDEGPAAEVDTRPINRHFDKDLDLKIASANPL